MGTTSVHSTTVQTLPVRSGFLVLWIAFFQCLCSSFSAHSASKWIGGHGNVIAGVVVDSGRFDWAASGKFPAFTEPTDGYHGMRYVKHFGKKAFAAKMRLELMRDVGVTMNPFAGWMLIQGKDILSSALSVKYSCSGCRIGDIESSCAKTH